MSNSGIDVTDQEWAQRVRRLGPQDRQQRLEHVSALLGQPEDLSDPLETELYILQEQLTAQAG